MDKIAVPVEPEMDTIAYAQLDPRIKFEPEGEEPITVKGGRKYAMILDMKTKTFKVEREWWFKFKVWLAKIVEEGKGWTVVENDYEKKQ